MSLSLSQLCDDYINHLRYERGCAQTTTFGYASWLRHFQNWCEVGGHGPDDLSRFTPTVLRAYLYAKSREGRRPRSIRSAFDPLRGLGEFLIAHNLLTENPAKAVTLPRKDAAQRLTVSNAEIVALLDACERLHPARRTALGRAIFYTLAYSGIRFAELRDLKTGDISFDSGTLLIQQGKGKKSRLLYPPTECLTALRTWTQERAKMRCVHDWLWAHDAKRRCGEEGIRNLVEEIKTVAGLRDAPNIKPHSLRHSFATRMHENGASLKIVQAALGHSQLTTTAIYLHLSEGEARKMAQYAVVKPCDVPAPAPAPIPEKPLRAQFQRQRRAASRR